MQASNAPRLVAFVVNPRTARDILRLASPRFEVSVDYGAAAALAALQSATYSASQAGGPLPVMVAEQSPGADDGTVTQSVGPGAAALLEAARIRCPAAHRVLLTPPEQLVELIPILHGGTVHVIASLPIDPKEFLAAITAGASAPRVAAIS